MDNFEIRRMSVLDIPLVGSLVEKNNLGFWSMSALLAELERSDSFCVVAKIKKRFAGFLISRLIISENIIEIYNIAVEEKFQRKGVGSKLINCLFIENILNPPFKIFLEVRASNLSAIKFYLSIGFNKAGERKNFYSHPVEDAFVMSLACEIDKILD